FQPRNRRFLLLVFAMLFEEFVQEHRVHRFVANAVHFSLSIAKHEIRVYLCYVLGYEAELRSAIRINLLFVPEGNWFEGENRFAGIVHRSDLVLESLRRGRGAKLTVGINLNCWAHNPSATDAGDKGGRLGSLRTDADGVGFRRGSATITKVDVV